MRSELGSFDLGCTDPTSTGQMPAYKGWGVGTAEA